MLTAPSGSWGAVAGVSTYAGVTLNSASNQSSTDAMSVRWVMSEARQIASPQLVTETMMSVSCQKCGPPESPKQVPPRPVGTGFCNRSKLFFLRPPYGEETYQRSSLVTRFGGGHPSKRP